MPVIKIPLVALTKITYLLVVKMEYLVQIVGFWVGGKFRGFQNSKRPASLSSALHLERAES